MEKVIRSPLSMMFFAVLFGGLIYSRFYSPEFLKPYTSWIIVTILIFLAIYFSLIITYNRQHPKKKIALFGWISYEIKKKMRGNNGLHFKHVGKFIYFIRSLYQFQLF